MDGVIIIKLVSFFFFVLFARLESRQLFSRKSSMTAI